MFNISLNYDVTEKIKGLYTESTVRRIDSILTLQGVT
jgi:hypothetical protein